ncbi:hypothetical protein [Leptotrichia sp. oral taxon 223]|uniref:hypothetical protein n=1 Tax=Leptotrichia sp. oral taxon 223 TaxID=712363 RepID=UPI0015BF0DD3|nr:hypothetical protein [Leptotrichia sp. oral taxon 223]NWO20175.1 hypothetical protein [Leptotrichia sp. oral taxon 223]
MELKLVIEIEEGSKPIIEKFSEALLLLGNTTTISNPAGTVVGKIQKFMQTTRAEDEYVKQEMKNWQTNDVKEVEEKNDNAEKSENIVEKAQKKVEEKPRAEAKTVETEAPKKEEASVPSAAVPTLTLEQLRAGCAEMSRLGKGAELRNLIRGVYEIQKLDDLDPKNYESFADNLRELGVRI